MPAYQDLAVKDEKSLVVSIGPGNVNTDREILTRILSNLLINAIKYSPADAKITFKSEFQDNFLSIQIINAGNIPDTSGDEWEGKVRASLNLPLG